jgi:hypothetical protein
MTRLTLAAACAALFTLTAGSAFADDAVVAKLQQPVAERTKFIAGGAMFVCEADACVAMAPTAQTFTTAACRTIAAKVGPVTAFTGRRPLDEARLSECNSAAVAKAPTGAVIAKR